jgi:glycosyltransferase involved in cell wall biosynthesis
LARLGVANSKIVPWDWAATTTPDEFPTKKLDARNIKLLYVGAVAKDKGCFDCIDAMTHLSDDKNHDYTLQIIGPGDLETAKAFAAQLPLPEKVSILGSISNAQVLQEMANASIVIVPSRHEYPEGMPNTVYEGLITRTPLIVSDHPVFAERFIDQEDVIFFTASQPDSLAEKIKYLVNHPLQYQALSNNSKALWLKLQMPLKWDELITAWLADKSAQSEILSKFALSNIKR